MLFQSEKKYKQTEITLDVSKWLVHAAHFCIFFCSNVSTRGRLFFILLLTVAGDKACIGLRELTGLQKTALLSDKHQRNGEP